jgi:elongation factor 4
MRQFLRRLAASSAQRRRLQAALQRNASHVSAQCDRSQCWRIKRALAQRYASSITSLDEQRLAALPVEKTVTFSIVAHVDHGKSSLAQRLLEMYGNIASTNTTSQSALDTLDVERERGITVKAVTASMLVGEYLVNLVDTPGHADFAHEVRRSLSACDGALLLVDASQGIEAQTLKVAAAARAAGVPLVCAASKIDLPTADAVEVALEMAALEFCDDPEKVLCVSAKSGDGVDAVLPAIIDAFKQPADDRRTRPTRCRVLDGRYDITRGVVAVIQCVDGALREGDRIAFLGGDSSEHKVQELGLLTPEHHRTGYLNAGCVGYLVAGLRDVRQARVGDTLCLATERDRLEPVDPLPPATQPGLFASVFPPDGGMFPSLEAEVMPCRVDGVEAMI